MPTLKHTDFEVPDFGEFAAPPQAVPGYAAAINALNPLGYWRMGEASGTTLADETGNYPLSLSGQYSLSQDGALQTDDDDSMLFNNGGATAGTSILPGNANDPFSIAFWARVPTGAINSGPFIGQYAAETNGHMRVFMIGDARLRYYNYGGTDLFSSEAITQDWRFFVLTRSSAGTVTWYADAVIDTQSTGGGSAIAAEDFVLGNVVPANPAVLYLDEVAVFDDELSMETIRWVYGLATGQLALPPGN